MKSAKYPTHNSGSHRVEVLLVDDHPAVREGLALLLAPEDIAVFGEAGSSAEAIRCVERRRPDAAIVDLSLDGETGLALISKLHERNIPVLVYSMHKDAQHIASAIAAGALGYVTKRELNGVLMEAVREVAAGRRFLSPVAAGALAEGISGSAAGDGIHKLSPNEQKVYALLGEGADTLDIAKALEISIHTVESYYSRILMKLEIAGMRELRRQAIARLQKHSE